MVHKKIMAKVTYQGRAGEPRGPRYVTATRAFQTAEDIIPIAELKADLSGVVRGLDARPRPLVVTLNGKPAAVVMSPREYDRLTAHARLVAALQEGLADGAAGRLYTDAEVFGDLEAEPASRTPAKPSRSRRR